MCYNISQHYRVIKNRDYGDYLLNPWWLKRVQLQKYTNQVKLLNIWHVFTRDGMDIKFEI